MRSRTLGLIALPSGSFAAGSHVIVASGGTGLGLAVSVFGGNTA